MLWMASKPKQHLSQKRLCRKTQKIIYGKQQHPSFLPTNQHLGTAAAQTGRSNTLKQRSEIPKVSLNRLAPGLFWNKEECLLSHSTAGLDTLPTYPKRQSGKMVFGREHDMLPAAKSRPRPDLLLCCSGVTREAKHSMIHQDGFVHTLTSES